VALRRRWVAVLLGVAGEWLIGGFSFA